MYDNVTVNINQFSSEFQYGTNYILLLQYQIRNLWKRNFKFLSPIFSEANHTSDDLAYCQNKNVRQTTRDKHKINFLCVRVTFYCTHFHLH